LQEDYVRPPIVAIEPPDPRVVKWRFRIVVFVLLAGVAIAVILIARALVASGEDSPTAVRPTAAVVTTVPLR
jgi:hypothetical protein